MTRRTLSRLLAVFCLLYLFLVYLFHRQLVPSKEESISDDYEDLSQHVPSDVIEREVTESLNKSLGLRRDNLDDSALMVQPAQLDGKHVLFNEQLRDLEKGMTKLERQISDVRLELINQVMARAEQLQRPGGGTGGPGPEGEAPQLHQQQDPQRFQLARPRVVEPYEKRTDERKDRGGEDWSEEQGELDEAESEEEEEEEDQQEEPSNEAAQQLQQRQQQELLLLERQQQEQQDQQRKELLFKNRKEYLQDLRRRRHQARFQRMNRAQGRGRDYHKDYRDDNYYNNDDYHYDGRGRPEKRRPGRPAPWGPRPQDMPDGPRKHPGKMLMGRAHPPEVSREGPEGREVGPRSGPPRTFGNSSLIGVSESAAVYSAYHDDRRGNETYVRLMMIVVGSTYSRRVLCNFESSTHENFNYVEAIQYEMCENHNKMYRGFIYSCPVPEALVRAPSYSLYLSSSDGYRVPVPVQSVNPPSLKGGQVADEHRYQYKYNYSVCVSPLFGSVSPERLVEFLELTRLLGVQQVFFYDYHVTVPIRKVLQFYQNKSWVTVLPWKLPTEMTESRIWYHGQLVTNNDCLYRTMSLSAFTAFHDIDEFIVPHSPGIRTLGQLLPPVLPNDTCGFSFHSAFFDPTGQKSSDPTGQKSSDKHFLMTSGTKRTEELSKVRTKVLVAPRRVFEVGIHHVSKQFQEHWESHPFNSSRAILHHYRKCQMTFGMDCRRLTKDTTIHDNFLGQLRDSFSRVMETLGL